MPKKLIKRYKTEINSKVKERMLVVLYFLEGRSYREISRLLYMSKDKARYWVRKYLKEGIQGLQGEKRKGREQRVDRSDLMTALQSTPRDFGFTNDVWTHDLIFKYLQQYQHLTINKHYLYQLLRNIGWKINKHTKVTPTHLELMTELSKKINAPIQRIVSERGIRPVLQITHQDRYVTIIEGETEYGKLSIRYEEYE